MSRSLAAAAAVVLLAVALVAAAASEDSKLVEEGDVEAAAFSNATGTQLGGNGTRPKEDTFADMIDRALEKEFTENEDHNEGFVRSRLLSLVICVLLRVNIRLWFF